MNKNDKDLFNIGEFAEKAGVTLRTLRYYDNIGLLKPTCYSEAGHRLYSKQDFPRLQQILTLKFIGFSLDDIKKIVKYDINHEENHENFMKSLGIQKKIMYERIQHTFMVIKAIDEVINVESKEEISWDKFANIINVINSNKKLLEQYEDASNLRSRISIHELFSVNKYGWMRWFFDNLELPPECKVLELGCGDASLWSKNIERIPKNWDVTLSDFSKGMLEDAKRGIQNKALNFKYQVIDAEDIPYEDESFDVVIANHMLYHVDDIEKVLSEIYRVLKPGGQFYSSTVGENHMKEMKKIMLKFKSDNMDVNSWGITSRFNLENGVETLEKWFKNIEMKRYKDNLIVTEPSYIIDYIFSMPGNVKESFDEERLKKLNLFLKDNILEKGGMHITKDTGFFYSVK